MNGAVLGLDLATSSVRALIVDSAGQILGRGQASYPTLHPQPGFDEQRPDDWWSAVEQAVGNARRFAPAAEVVAIGITGQMHGTVLLGDSREPLAPAVVWSDQRSASLSGSVELAPDIASTIGGPLGPGYQALTLAWYQQSAPHLVAATRHVLLPISFLGLLLTGQLMTVPSDAVSTGLFDIGSGSWSDEIGAALGIDPTWLPPVRPEGALVGYLSDAAAAMLELPGGIPVHHGGGDALAAAVAAGVTASGDALITINTGAQVLRPVDDSKPEPAGRWHTWPSALPAQVPGDRWAQVGVLRNGGRILEWLQRTLAPGVSLPDLLDLAQTSPAGANGLLFLPYLAGERSPRLDPLARGAFIGLSDQHSAADMVRAALEGMALALADTLDRMTGSGEPPERIVIAGGGAPAFVRQILASVLGRRLDLAASQDGASLGAARIAAHQHDVTPLRTDSARAGATSGTVLPNPLERELYAGRLTLFREAIDVTLPVIHQLHQP